LSYPFGESQAELKSLAEELKSVLKRQQEVAQRLLEDGFQEVFNEFPDVYAITWNQYTPFFNDGDECVFRIGGYNILSEEAFRDEDHDRYDEMYAFSGPWRDENYVDHYATNRERYGDTDFTDEVRFAPAADMITSLLKDVPDTVFKQVYGDHTEVTITREGTNTEYYVHE
jgi:hypothetical protein